MLHRFKLHKMSFSDNLIRISRKRLICIKLHVLKFQIIYLTNRYQHYFCILPSSKAGALKPSKGPFRATVKESRVMVLRPHQIVIS